MNSRRYSPWLRLPFGGIALVAYLRTQLPEGRRPELEGRVLLTVSPGAKDGNVALSDYESELPPVQRTGWVWDQGGVGSSWTTSAASTHCPWGGPTPLSRCVRSDGGRTLSVPGQRSRRPESTDRTTVSLGRDQKGASPSSLTGRSTTALVLFALTPWEPAPIGTGRMSSDPAAPPA